VRGFILGFTLGANSYGYMGGQMSQNAIIVTAAFQCIYRTSYL